MSKKNNSLFLNITGGGTEAIGKLLREGGASSYFNGAYIPYDTERVDKCVGGKVDKYCSREAAEKLAIVAFQQAALGKKDVNPIGVGVSASLAKANQRQGRINEAHVVIQTTKNVDYQHVTYDERWDRVTQEDRLSDLIVEHVKSALLPNIHALAPLNDSVVRNGYDGDTMFNHYVNKEPVALFLTVQDGEPYVLFPGSFNPMHEGHLAMAEAAHKVTGKKVVFELSTLNFQKAIISPREVDMRAKALADFQTADFWGGLIVTVAPFMYDKVKMLTPEWLAMGYDTAIRFFATMGAKELDMLMGQLSRWDGKLLVFHRMGYENEYADAFRKVLDIRPDFGPYVQEVSLADYADNGVSSTLLRSLDG